MIPVKPYFLRAYFDWIVDNGWTPLVLVDATVPGASVPTAYVKDGKIVLNLALRAIRNLEMENDVVTFSTRFGGVAHQIVLPMGSVLAVYAEENGQILSFPPEPELPVTDAATEGKTDTERGDLPVASEPPPAQTSQPPRGRPTLRVVKKDD